jgi:hypothetical protein
MASKSQFNQGVTYRAIYMKCLQGMAKKQVTQHQWQNEKK